MHFEDPWLLWILVPVAVVWAAGLVWSVFGRGRAAVRFSQVQRLKRLRPPLTLRLRQATQLLRVVVIGLLLLGMARPQTGRKHSRVITEGIDIVLVLDTSGSMKALDLDTERSIRKRRNRLEVARDVVKKFVEGRENDQIGLVVFGEDAYTQCPLTLDHGILVTLLERAKIGMAGDSTAIGSAIGTAVKRLKKSKAESRVIVLLTDGQNNAGSLAPKQAAEIAKTFDIKIYTIGAGTKGKAPFIVEHPLFGKQVVYQSVPIDDAALTEVARIGGGQYYRATDADSLDKIYKTIDQLEKTEIEVKTYMEYEERFEWFVFPALGLLLLEMLLLGTRLRKIP